CLQFNTQIYVMNINTITYIQSDGSKVQYPLDACCFKTFCHLLPGFSRQCKYRNIDALLRDDLLQIIRVEHFGIVDLRSDDTRIPVKRSYYIHSIIYIAEFIVQQGAPKVPGTYDCHIPCLISVDVFHEEFQQTLYVVAVSLPAKLPEI